MIGAGMSGLLAGIRLAEAGVEFTIIEKNPGVGGTWFENRYPGCRVDVGNHFYSYSFAPDDAWTEFFAQQPELQAYFHRCMVEHGIADRIRFDTEVTSARWDEASATWTVETSGGTHACNRIDHNEIAHLAGYGFEINAGRNARRQPGPYAVGIA